MESGKGSWVKVARGESIPPEGARAVRVGVKRIGLFRDRGGALRAMQDNCPHAGGSLAAGARAGWVVRCPRHDWAFDLRDGRCADDPRYRARVYQVREESGWVYLLIP